MSVRKAVAVIAALLAVLFAGGAAQASPAQASPASAEGPRAAAAHSDVRTAAVRTAAAGPFTAQGSCTYRNVSHYDAYTKRTWTSDWVCGNRAGAPLYACGSFISACPVIGWLDTSPSWFVCWGRGAWHNGGNNIWYYTKGDRMASGEAGHHGWGFIPAVDVWTSTDPWPGMTECNIP
ncbi:hypothetical protein [Streptomyces purpureus]|uniref:hypothetical protein n=1 Tax=Streptomyces purpureus TaxID=1951 RepID=UPI00048D512B|nr:hypothetical protein [Streptomyces purpureus]